MIAAKIAAQAVAEMFATGNFSEEAGRAYGEQLCLSTLVSSATLVEINNLHVYRTTAFY